MRKVKGEGRGGEMHGVSTVLMTLSFIHARGKWKIPEIKNMKR